MGGCVRDFLANRDPKDIDIATNATPEEVQKIFPKVIDLGAKFGVVLVVIEGVSFEVSTFRKDVGYNDGRRPERIEYSTEKEDALRRDFTVNALYWDYSSKKILDYVNGQEDIKKNILQTVGKPKDRFFEDQLRILRALRFSSELSMDIHPETMAAIYNHHVNDISKERVLLEVKKAFMAPRSLQFICDLESTKVLTGLFGFSVKKDGLWNLSLCQVINKLDQEKIDPDVLWLVKLSLYFQMNLVELSFVSEPICHVANEFNRRVDNWPLSKSEKKTLINFYNLMLEFLNFSSLGSALILIEENYYLNLKYLGLVEKHFLLDEPLMTAFSKNLKLTKESFERLSLDEKLPAPLVKGQWLIEEGVEEKKNYSYYLKKCYIKQLEGHISDLNEAREFICELKKNSEL